MNNIILLILPYYKYAEQNLFQAQKAATNNSL